jgi:hypothetical protein
MGYTEEEVAILNSGEPSAQSTPKQTLSSNIPKSGKRPQGSACQPTSPIIVDTSMLGGTSTAAKPVVTTPNLGSSKIVNPPLQNQQKKDKKSESSSSSKPKTLRKFINVQKVSEAHKQYVRDILLYDVPASWPPKNFLFT